MVLKSADTEVKPPFCQVPKNYVEYLPIFFDRPVHTMDAFRNSMQSCENISHLHNNDGNKKIHFVENGK
jgi:hypothetical protein